VIDRGRLRHKSLHTKELRFRSGGRPAPEQTVIWLERTARMADIGGAHGGNVAHGIRAPRGRRRCRPAGRLTALRGIRRRGINGRAVLGDTQVIDTDTTNIDVLRRTLQRLTAEPGGRKGKGYEKRRYHRHYYTVEARAKYVKRVNPASRAPEEFKVLTKDLSRGGMSFVHEFELYPGEVVQVEVRVGEIRRAFLLRVIRCRRAGLRVFDIAAQFITAEEV